MDRRAFLKAGAMLAASLPLAAFIEQEMPDPAAPVHIQNDDPGWAILNGATLTVDEARGLMKAAFTPDIRALEGKPFRIGGFMLPLDTRSSFTHFVLTRRNTTCSFCPPNELTEAIEIFAVSELTFTADEYVVSGVFETIADSAEGLFYRLRDARVERLQ
ncbi:MAG: hypothetical protein U1F24_09210 [Alphaproteobacteria bacterium]|jgi:hypothetical protein